jgi:transketolase
MTDQELHELKTFAVEIRKEIVTMIARAGSGHPGGSLSAVDILTVLYRKFMKYNPVNPKWEGRDRFILSKGHAAPVLYAVLAYCNYFPKEVLLSFRNYGSILQGHPDGKKVPGVEIATGSLGQGLSIGGGMALAAKTKKLPWRTYVLLGDGELQEGQVWEAAMAIGHYKLGNLTAIVDNNQLQIDGPVVKVMNVEPIADKFVAFGWKATTVDGHDYKQIEAAFRNSMVNGDEPTVIIAKTIKGKGISFMENKVEYHHAKGLIKELYDQAISELNSSLEG